MPQQADQQATDQAEPGVNTVRRSGPERAAEVPTSRPGSGREWTFLTNHAHVLLCVTADPDVLLRDIALKVGITERAAQLIVTDLEAAGYLTRTRVGRRNHYSVRSHCSLRHPLESHRTVQVLLDIVTAVTGPTVTSTQR